MMGYSQKEDSPCNIFKCYNLGKIRLKEFRYVMSKIWKPIKCLKINLCSRSEAVAVADPGIPRSWRWGASPFGPKNCYYHPQSSCGKVVFTGICDSVHRGVCGRHPPGQTPPRQTPPYAQCMPGYTPPRQTPCLGRHPPGRHPPCLVHAGIHTPLDRHPPKADTPLPSACWDTHPPCPEHTGIHTPCQCMIGYFPPPPAATAADGTHPTGMHSCLTRFLLKTARKWKKLGCGELVTPNVKLPKSKVTWSNVALRRFYFGRTPLCYDQYICWMVFSIRSTVFLFLMVVML